MTLSSDLPILSSLWCYLCLSYLILSLHVPVHLLFLNHFQLELPSLLSLPSTLLFLQAILMSPTLAIKGGRNHNMDLHRKPIRNTLKRTKHPPYLLVQLPLLIIMRMLLTLSLTTQPLLLIEVLETQWKKSHLLINDA